tara:strand:+ start:17 stop:694 length:678 start_codon:yes stop_codon:yes gene_type:complete
MISKHNILILAAGRGLAMDGMHKLKLSVPKTNENLKTRLERQFSSNLNVVIGYKGAEILSEWPEVNFSYNHKWYETGSAVSALIGLEELQLELPIIIMPCDLILSDSAIHKVLESEGDVVFLKQRENRSENSLNCITDSGKILDSYRGQKRNNTDLEALGIVKISSQECLTSLLSEASKAENSYFVEYAVESFDKFSSIEISEAVNEVNSVEDYLSLWGTSNDFS